MKTKINKRPYRKNCEGYFIYRNYVVAKKTCEGYVVFPGGGIDKKETPESALLREAFEEAGLISSKKLISKGILFFDWGPEWAKTQKQKSRYKKFRGEEMHFFVGEADKLVKPQGDPDDAWKGKKYLPIKKAIELIEKEKPFSEDIKKYREKQIKILKSLNK